MSSRSDSGRIKQHNSGSEMARVLRRALGDDACVFQSLSGSKQSDGDDVANSYLVLKPRDPSQVQFMLEVVQQSRLGLVPSYTGRYDGLPAIRPEARSVAILDLSLLKQISEFDPYLGTVAIGPGVTQNDLYRFLAEQGGEWLVPVDDSGGGASLVEAALDFKCATTPQTDRFSAVQALRIILADGRAYNSAPAGDGIASTNRLNRHGPGPYLDGLFCHGNNGVVVQMTVALVRRPQVITGVVAALPETDTFELAIIVLRDILNELTGQQAAFSLVNRSALCKFSRIPEDRSKSIPAWSLWGTILGHRRLLAGTRRIVRDRLRPLVSRPWFYDGTHLHKGLARMWQDLPWSGRPDWIRDDMASAMYSLGSGVPVAVDAGIADKAATIPDLTSAVPMKAHQVREYVRLVESSAASFHQRPAIRLTNLCRRCLGTSVSVAPVSATSRELSRALSWRQALVAKSVQEGWLPRDRGSRPAVLSRKDGHSFWEVARQVNTLLDPNGILGGCNFTTEQPERSRRD